MLRLRFNKVLALTILSLISMAALISSVNAAALVHADVVGPGPLHHWTPRFADDAANRHYRVELDPTPCVVLGPGAGGAQPNVGLEPGDRNRLEADFPPPKAGVWTFTNDLAAPGNITEVRYDVTLDLGAAFTAWDPLVRGFFTIDYKVGAPPVGTVWHLIQVIHTNDPGLKVPAGMDGVYVDPQPPCNGPFYYTEAERVRFSAGGAGGPGGPIPANVAIRFVDRPRRPLADAPVDWEAHLYLVYFKPPNTVNVCEEIKWGFHIRWICHAKGNNVLGGVGGDKCINATFNTETNGTHTDNPEYPKYTPEAPCGGTSISIAVSDGKVGSYLGVESTIIVATVATGIYVKRVKRRKEKQ